MLAAPARRRKAPVVDSPPMSPSQPAPRRNAEATRARILAAAREAFAELGYAEVGLRQIAARAGTSAPLVLRYFGSKAALFEAALASALRVEAVTALPRASFGEALAAQLLSAAPDADPVAMVALASGNAEASAIATRLVRERMLAPLAAWLGPPAAERRAARILMLGMGFRLFTRQFPLHGEGPPPADQVTWFATTIQALVEGRAE